MCLKNVSRERLLIICGVSTTVALVSLAFIIGLSVGVAVKPSDDSTDKVTRDILVLGESSQMPIIINSHGKDDRLFYFEYGNNTEVYKSCSLMGKNDMYIFGGDDHESQISKVDSCKVSRIGDLPFSQVYGGCVSIDDQLIHHWRHGWLVRS